MPRWLIASILAIMLSCYSFGALAQAVPGVHPHGPQQGTAQMQAEALVSLVSSQQDPQDDEPQPLSDKIDVATAAHGETGYDHAEAFDGLQRLRGPQRLSEPPARPLPTVAPTPLLERPKRPPRLALLSA
ncbi:hypothetical protein [Variovorax ginsengisoli]|uniref:DUF4148 domain-containing protein n=1 Tax=Variovorax ginsengisoli TaxID=363844 RepID=A0ABT9S8C5_9BURK|nr:hypothetical protein [Variovorax ginsengisoli]MDP9900600.1 hypothetical protein [Variovorax ginsengisoli]